MPAQSGPRVDVRAAFDRDRAALLDLLRELGPQDWRRPTAASPWTVREVVAHVLGDDLNRLSRGRDGYAGEGPAAGETLAAFVHRINDEWVRATVRHSPAVLVELLELTTRQVLAFWAGTDVDALGGPVTWAGPDPAPVWLDCARDFTEYWVHQQQVRDAVGRPGPGTGPVPEGTHAVLDVFLRAVPLTLADCARPDGTTLSVQVDGPAGGRWAWRRTAGEWLPGTPAETTGTEVRFPDASTLWRLCVRMLDPDDAARHVTVVGDRGLAGGLLRIVSIIR